MKGGHKAHHHGKHKASGGRTHEKVFGNPDVFKEAEEKHGAPVHDMKRGGHAKKHRAAGGKVIGLMTGGAVRPRIDRPGRKRGGGVGADKSPLSSAHKGEHPGGKLPRSEDTYGGTPAD